MPPVILHFVVFFPFLLPVWTQRPFVDEDLRPGDYPLVTEKEEIAAVLRGLKHADRDLRSTLYREIRDTEMPEATAALLSRLPKEEDEQVVATILQQLCLSAVEPEVEIAQLSPYLASTNEDVRLWATHLAGRCSGIGDEKLAELALKETIPAICEAAADELRLRGRSVPVAVWKTLFASENQRIVALAVEGCISCSAGSTRDLPANCLEASVPVRFALARALSGASDEGAKRLLAKLSLDAFPGVRGMVAESIGKRGLRAEVPTLLKLLQDPDAEVRRLAALSCAVFPLVPVRSALIAGFSDKRHLVRCQIEDSLVTLNATLPVAEFASARLQDRLTYVRFHSYRLLGRLDARVYAEAIAEGLPGEKLAENIAAAIHTLGRFNARFAAMEIANYAAHPAAEVREAVGEALGLLQTPATYDKIRALAFDKEEEVRQAAILAMGHLGAGKEFSKTILRVLKTVKPAQMSGANHGAAAWSAARLRPLDYAVVERLVLHATTPVIPGDMGEMLFELDCEMASFIFSLAQQAQDDAKVLPAFKKVYASHSRSLAEGTMLPTGAYSPSAEVSEAARQALAYLEGKSVEKAKRPTSKRAFSYGKLKLK